MFGNNAITSSWANPQQNQQPQQQQQQQGTSAFGQPTAFGSTGFGASTGAFGQPQQQPQANPMFGGLGGTSNTGTSAFGANNQASSNTSSVFGTAKPATGFGAFGGGGTSAFGSGGTSAFGNTGQTTTNTFGQPATTSAFGGGTGGSIFGQPKTNSAFGTTTTTNATAPVTTGSSNPPYATTPEKDASITLQYQSISCMPAYTGTSFEELRVQDYQQGRKTATTGAFGQPPTFGGTQTTGGSLFGQLQNNQPAQTSSIFGAPKPTTGFGPFGGNTANTGGFASSSNAFGQAQQQQPQQQQQQPSTGFGFGQTQQQPQQQTTSLFGGGSAFGNTNSTGGAFGTSAFGTNTNQQPQPQQTGSIFGQSQPAANTSGAFGTFGNNAAKPSIFGQSAQPAGQTSIFGQSAPQNQQQQQPSIFGNSNTASTGLFGNSTNQQQQQPQQPGTSLFGNTQTNTGTGTGGIFGSGAGTGLFGNTNNQQQQQQIPQQQTGTTGFGSNLFGPKPAAPAGGGGIFGNNNAFGATQPTSTAQQQPSLFGNAFNQSTNQQQAAAGGGLFHKAPSMGMSTSTGTGGNLFGNPAFGNSTNTLAGSTAAPGQQNSLVASINQPIAPNLPIFSMLPPGPRAIDLEQSTKKKVPFFVDIPTRSPVPRVQLGYTPANSKLRGFGSLTSNSALNGSIFAPSNSSVLTLSRSQTPKQSIEAIFGTQSSPSLGSGQRKSVKKLILDKKVEPTELFVKSGSSPLRGGKIMFSPALSIAAREREAAAAAASPPPSQPAKSPTPTPQPQRTTKKFTASQNGQGADEDELQEGDYYVKPNMETLKSSGFDQLSSFKDLVVGRVGYGEIHFLEPVDLTGLLKLGELLGGVIRFEDKECSVYPDADDTEKPPEGSGLNVRAKISLKRCWAMDKAHREPIKDEKHPTAVKHLKKLRNMKDTHFEGFDFSDGTWTFTVDHF